MERKAKLNQSTFCRLCKSSINQNFEHCKKCNVQKNIKIFYFDIKSNNSKWKDESQGRSLIFNYNNIF
jgi:hypothetical protein